MELNMGIQEFKQKIKSKKVTDIFVDELKKYGYKDRRNAMQVSKNLFYLLDVKEFDPETHQFNPLEDKEVPKPKLEQKSINALIESKKNLRDQVAKTMGLKNKKKVTRFLKRYECWDFSYLIRFIARITFSKRKDRELFKEKIWDVNDYSIKNWDDLLEHEEYAEKYTTDLLTEVFATFSYNQWKCLQAFILWMACEYRIYACATWDYTYPSINTMLKTVIMIENEQYKEIPEFFARYYQMWWD